MHAHFLQRSDRGSPDWWQALARRGTPLVEADGAAFRVTFIWRDPQGGEATSALRHVWLNITGRTDHHQPGPPQSLARLPGSDIWHWQTLIEADWRGSYSFMPSEQPLPPAQGREAVRSFWQALFPLAQADPLNPLPAWQGQRGLAVSPLHMPGAPAQTAWALAEPSRAPVVHERHWHSQRLGNSRRVWWFATGAGELAERPLAILLDGDFWATSMPVAAPLMHLTEAGRLPAALYLLVDSIDTAERGRELTCNPDFWLALQDELLPQLQAWAPHSQEPARTLVAGQSFGGLAAVYAALNWPTRFGAALSQSGSFWWPRREPSPDTADSGLLAQIEQGLGADLALRLYLEAGRREPLIHAVNQRLVDALARRGQPVDYHLINGGHDALCWRGGLLDGLCALWAPLSPSNTAYQEPAHGHPQPLR
jgi:enterochelin esterase family protein